MVERANTYIPRDQGKRVLVSEFGNTDTIISEMLATAKKNPLFMARFAQRIKGPTVLQTLKNLWTFTKFNVPYVLDELGTQDIQTAPAIWWRKQCDCKGYALFIQSILKPLGIHSNLKFASYDPTRDVTHVYIIVPKQDGSYTTLDGCMTAFNEEKPPVKTIIK